MAPHARGVSVVSAAKHTPGKWVIKSFTEYDKDGAIESCGDQVVARLPNGDEVGIFTTALEGEPLDDLRLIAAAPNLAFQLLAAANYIDALGGNSRSYRQAYADATGESA